MVAVETKSCLFCVTTTLSETAPITVPFISIRKIRVKNAIYSMYAASTRDITITTQEKFAIIAVIITPLTKDI